MIKALRKEAKMYTRKYIREAFKVRIDNKGSKEICFQYRSNVPGDFLVEGRSRSPLGALYNIVFNLNATLRNSNAGKPKVSDQVKIVDSFVRNHHSDISSTEEYSRLMHQKKYATWSYYIIDRLDFHNFLKPTPFRYFNLAVCWNGVGPVPFKGRSTHDILRDFAISNRRLNANLEAHRFGIAKFIENFKKFCTRYFGFDSWDDEAFLKCCIDAGLFREDNQAGENL